MATYFFETIIPLQASAYNAASDNLVFQTNGETASNTTVIFNPNATIVLVSSLTGRRVEFGTRLEGETPIFPDGSLLFIGSAGNDSFAADAPSDFGRNDGAYGGAGNDTLNGAKGNDLLQGNSGDDSLIGGEGNDVIYGGQNNDTIDVGDGSNFAQGNLGNDTVTAATSTMANTLLGGQGDDRITGGGSNDFLNGNLGNDSIAGGGGSDLIFGEGGNDTLQGGRGADTLSGGDGGDRFAFGAFDSGIIPASLDRITDWDVFDTLVFGAGPGEYVEATAANFSEALALANTEIGRIGARYVVVQVGADLIIFVDSLGNLGAPEDAIMLVGRTLSDISREAIVG